MPPFLHTAKFINLQSILYKVGNSTMSGNIAQNEKTFERNFSNVTAMCGWLLVMLK